MGLEDAVLLAVGQTRIQRQNFGVAQVALAQRVGGITDFALAAHKDQNIARAFVAQLVHGIKNGLQLIALGVVGVFDHRTVAYFYRVRAA